MKQNSEAQQGRIVAISVSRQKGVKKTNTKVGSLETDYGIRGDAHGGSWHRQLSLLDMQSITKIKEQGFPVRPGDFAENITTTGLKLWKLPLGTRLRLGKVAVVEVTQIGKECHSRCAIYHQVGDCVMPREGIFARVIKGGNVLPGDEIYAIPQAEIEF
jgi:MOSC domain-containing protein YiiM